MKYPQDEGEIQAFIKILKDNGVRKYLEIGTREGFTFHRILTEIGCEGVAVDLPNGPWGRSASLDTLRKITTELGATLILGDSTEEETRDEIRRHGPYDATFIDGDHRLLGVTKDWNFARTVTTKLIGFHDINGLGMGTANMAVEVPHLWEAIKGRYTHAELVNRSVRLGIGVIFLER